MKKIMLIICLLLLSGCSDYVEINDLAVITGIALNYKDDMFDVTTELIINEDMIETKIYNTKAPSIEKALAEISKMCNKQLFLSDMKALILTDNIIINNINYYDFFLRDSKSKMNFYIYVTPEDNIEKIFKIYEDNKGSALYVDKMMQFNEKIFSSSTPLEFIELVHILLENKISPIYPEITVKDNANETILFLENLVTYNEEKKLTLDENQSIIFNIINNKNKNSIIEFNCDDKYFTLKIESNNTTYSFKNNTLKLNINLVSKLESFTCNYNIENNNTINKLIKITKREVKDKINKLINTQINENIDILGIKNYLYKHYNIENKELKDINYDINIDVSINSLGETRESMRQYYE